MSPPRSIAEIQADIRANNARVAELRNEISNLESALKAANRELDERATIWGGTVASRLKSELAEAERYEDNRRYPEVRPSATGGRWFVMSLTPKQAKIRNDGGTECTVRSGSNEYVVTLEACRAAWVAAGRTLP